MDLAICRRYIVYYIMVLNFFLQFYIKYYRNSKIWQKIIKEISYKHRSIEFILIFSNNLTLELTKKVLINRKISLKS